MVEPSILIQKIGELIEPDGKICLHGCNVGGIERDTDGNVTRVGPAYVQSIANSAKRRTEAWTGQTEYGIISKITNNGDLVSKTPEVPASQATENR